MGLVTLVLARTPWRVYSGLLLVPLSFSLASSMVVAFMHGTGSTLFSVDLLQFHLGVRKDGADLALLLLLRTLGGMSALFFIALTTPMIEIFAVIKSLHVPDTVVELSMMIYRYIFVFLDQAAMIHSAQVMRLGDSRLRNSLCSFAMLSSVLFLRSWEQGERLIIAMDARCYRGKLDIMEREGRAGAGEMLAVAIYFSVLAAISILTRGLWA